LFFYVYAAGCTRQVVSIEWVAIGLESSMQLISFTTGGWLSDF